MGNSVSTKRSVPKRDIKAVKKQTEPPKPVQPNPLKNTNSTVDHVDPKKKDEEFDRLEAKLNALFNKDPPKSKAPAKATASLLPKTRSLDSDEFRSLPRVSMPSSYLRSYNSGHYRHDDDATQPDSVMHTQVTTDLNFEYLVGESASERHTDGKEKKAASPLRVSVEKAHPPPAKSFTEEVAEMLKLEDTDAAQKTKEEQALTPAISNNTYTYCVRDRMPPSVAARTGTVTGSGEFTEDIMSKPVRVKGTEITARRLTAPATTVTSEVSRANYTYCDRRNAGPSDSKQEGQSTNADSADHRKSAPAALGSQEPSRGNYTYCARREEPSHSPPTLGQADADVSSMYAYPQSPLQAQRQGGAHADDAASVASDVVKDDLQRADDLVPRQWAYVAKFVSIVRDRRAVSRTNTVTINVEEDLEERGERDKIPDELASIRDDEGNRLRQPTMSFLWNEMLSETLSSVRSDYYSDEDNDEKPIEQSVSEETDVQPVDDTQEQSLHGDISTADVGATADVSGGWTNEFAPTAFRSTNRRKETGEPNSHNLPAGRHEERRGQLQRDSRERVMNHHYHHSPVNTYNPPQRYPPRQPFPPPSRASHQQRPPPPMTQQPQPWGRQHPMTAPWPPPSQQQQHSPQYTSDKYRGRHRDDHGNRRGCPYPQPNIHGPRPGQRPRRKSAYEQFGYTLEDSQWVESPNEEALRRCDKKAQESARRQKGAKDRRYFR